MATIGPAKWRSRSAWAMLQHELATVGGRVGHGGRLILVTGSAPAAAHSLLRGALSCPDCGGPVAPYGFARPRMLRGLAATTELRPRRARCASCAKTHVVLPGEVVPRRRDDASVIGRALLRAATGARPAEIAAELGRSSSTVRNWLRRLSEHASDLHGFARRALLTYDASADPMRLVWLESPVARAVEALGAAAAAVVRRQGPLPSDATLWGVVCVLTRGRLLAPDFSP